MAKLSASTASSSGRRCEKRGGTVAFGTIAAILVLIGAIIALTMPSKQGGSSPLSRLFADAQCTEPCVPGSEAIMKQKAHGTSEYPVQQNLRWEVDWDTADRINNFNRHYAEFAGYWESTSFLSEFKENIENESGEVTFYDSGWKGSPLFTAPRDRSWKDFIAESKKHGWPSFRDSEVDWDYARVLPGGEMVSVDGSHLGHNLPDGTGNRYCINLVSIAGSVSSNASD
uniref:Uncharacterized protein n=1 Tax=Pseudo-nitzschia australis TaxID=44445 RepID=A0A7S4ANY3_9STRA|mmetsp:Transcript_19107/g.41496  ORF Transcript_19107/g.41496 Transcript_19107/m.41496 type:complete len:228 (+) Transcript_19107:53-736(+)|eukprot:CAMPEP_0168185824 /NCGR_PEP_ID=MMETSP0139_2-20121125/14065_1 /TAXON_ID=44445 /ORGANISM="Pseudo-nitzschia australis, Strain 10249 10 AB" /LENGTH=227 /DNA_ID=CAMNT_0008107711 /DNA_START=47 /DNA_END=730 /DNA_ORIENTATION=-